jgi:hypothetical protein
MEFLKNNTEFNTYLDIEYIRERNTYKFTNKMTEGNIKIIPNKFIGVINNQLLVETSAEGSYINLTNYSHIIIKSNNILFEDNQEDNINNKEMSNSSILFMLDKQDVPPFQLISYKNDKGDNYSFNITNRQINSIDLHLYNEKGELLTNTDDYFLTLKFVIFNKEEIQPDTSYLEDIRFILMNLMFNKKNLMLK